MHHFLTFLGPLRGAMHHFLRADYRYIRPLHAERPTPRGAERRPAAIRQLLISVGHTGVSTGASSAIFQGFWHQMLLKPAHFSGPQGLRNNVPEGNAPFLMAGGSKPLHDFLT